MSVILKFIQIKNFRSIADSGKFYVPTDGITVLVGQNESGKTSIIDALEAFDTRTIDNEDRTDRSLPSLITCTFCLPKKDLEVLLDHGNEYAFISQHMLNDELELEITVSFPPKATAGQADITSPFFTDYLMMLSKANEEEKIDEADQKELKETSDESAKYISGDDFEELFLELYPVVSIFKHDSLLPREMQLDELSKKPQKMQGVKGVTNFLKVLDVSVDKLKEASVTPTEKETLQAKLNRDFSVDFNNFWRQEVVPGNRANIHISLANIPAGQSNAGAEILRFTVETLGKYLYPDQRSHGFQWFLSFYLQLMALRKTTERPHLLLIDEPGAHLHVKAKEDLLAVLEEVKQYTQIIYTTHEPELIDRNKLNRIRIVAQTAEEGTKVYSIEKASTEMGARDALSPIYKAMGADFSIVKSDRAKTIILEEPSAYYYLVAWKKLLGIKEDIFLLPAMGANNVPLYFNLLMGWGFKCKVVVDDDTNGRRAVGVICEEWALSEDEKKAKILKLKEGPTIEDLFLEDDFAKLVYTSGKTEIRKLDKKGKALLAKNFLDKVDKKEIEPRLLSSTTTMHFEDIFKFILN